MINLLPPGQKRRIEKEYKFRLGSVYILLISIAIGIGFILLIPSYFTVSVRATAAEESLAVVKASSENAEREEVMAVLQDAKEKLTILTDEEERVLVSEIITAMSLHVIPGIDVTSVAYTRGRGEEHSVLTVGGYADTRDDLISFEKTLEADDLFEEVILPVSSLVEEVDIKFSIQIKGAF